MQSIESIPPMLSELCNAALRRHELVSSLATSDDTRRPLSELSSERSSFCHQPFTGFALPDRFPGVPVLAGFPQVPGLRKHHCFKFRDASLVGGKVQAARQIQILITMSHS